MKLMRELKKNEENQQIVQKLCSITFGSLQEIIGVWMETNVASSLLSIIMVTRNRIWFSFFYNYKKIYDHGTKWK